MKKITALVMTAAMVLSLAACGQKQPAQTQAAAPAATQAQAAAPAETKADAPAETQAAAPEASAEETHAGGTFKSIETFMYSSLDPHKDYYSWHSQKYGLTESLFRINDNNEVEPWMAASIETEGTVSTIKMNDGLCFSNGEPCTTEMMVRNIQRLGENNKRFKMMLDWKYETPDDKTLIIDTVNPYPTLINDLASPEICFMDLDNTTDFDNAPICTGPFVVDTFVPSGDLTLKRNDNYWGGHVNLDAAVFYAMSDDQSKLMAMQNGEINAYDNISSTDIEIFSMEPEVYNLYHIPTNFIQYIYLNPANVPASVREAIALVVDRDAMAAFLPGIMEPSKGFFAESAPYGANPLPDRDEAKAREVLEADGYTLENGVYTKDGAPLHLVLSTYAARSQDKLAVLLQEQLTNFGIGADIKLCEDPDSTYMSGEDFDICFYRKNCDKSGDPYYMIHGTVETGSYEDITHFGNPETDALINELAIEPDTNRRYELANEIMDKYYKSFVGIPLVRNARNTVMYKGVTNYNDANPNEFYGLNKDTTTND